MGNRYLYFRGHCPYQPRQKDMKTTSFVLAIACLSVPFVPSVQAQQPPLQSVSSHQLGQFESHDRAEIENVLKSYEQSLNAGDVSGVVQLYTEDAVLMAPGSPSAVGIQSVQA